MEAGGSRTREKKRKRALWIAGIGILVLVVILALVLGLTLRKKPDEFKTTFFDRCKKFKQYDCQKVWEAFQQAYVGRDPCTVSMEAYDPFIAAAPFEAACNRMMFWSKTKDVVHAFTEKRDCFVTLEDTLVGSALDGLTWCGKEGSTETLTTGCPGWEDCNGNNPVRSFWNRASAAFADAACGRVTVMLNGSIATPFSPTSIFASIELKRLNSTIVKSLDVVLIQQTNSVSNCTNASLKDLQRDLANGITYNCKEVAEAQVQACAADPQKPCGSCW